MKFVHVLVAAATVAIAGTAVAQTDQPATAEPAKEKKICRTETVTGSLMRKRRTCMTAEEWNQLDRNTQEDMRRFTDKQNRFEPSNPTMGVSGPPR
jgi:predicted secreted protein